ncbi:MAG: SMC-Scp complex subunit ScpB [Ruminococcaceae bacterium]|nr:SMC-Scp complex subunit ScpB [Oscillospiraceae bacterium]
MSEQTVSEKAIDCTDEELPDINGAEAENIIEAVLFAAGHPLEYAKIGKLFGVTPTETKKRVAAVAEKFNERSGALTMLALDDCAQICTREEFAPYIRDALGIRKGGNLSNSSIETLAIVAYNQPVTRVYVDTVRGVDSSYAVNSLLERGLIEVVGRLDQPGRPMLYGTTPDFLRCFGLSSLKDLPEVDGAGSAPAVLLNLTIDDMLNETENPDTAENSGEKTE